MPTNSLGCALCLCVVASIVPFFPLVNSAKTSNGHIQFPSQLNGYKLDSYALSKSERSFYAAFPGEAKKFRWVGSEYQSIMIRFVPKPSRRLHSAETCYQAHGYNVKALIPGTVSISGFGTKMPCNRFLATGSGGTYEISQCIVSLHGRAQYPDIQSWYWQTRILKKDRGPWVCFTLSKAVVQG